MLAPELAAAVLGHGQRAACAQAGSDSVRTMCGLRCPSFAVADHQVDHETDQIARG